MSARSTSSLRISGASGRTHSFGLPRPSACRGIRQLLGATCEQHVTLRLDEDDMGFAATPRMWGFVEPGNTLETPNFLYPNTASSKRKRMTQNL